MWYLVGFGALWGLAATGVATYYRWKLSALTKLLDAGDLERRAWASQNDALRDQVVAAQKALADRQAKEEKQDAETADSARGDAGRVAELLNGLADPRTR